MNTLFVYPTSIPGVLIATSVSFPCVPLRCPREEIRVYSPVCTHICQHLNLSICVYIKHGSSWCLQLYPMTTWIILASSPWLSAQSPTEKGKNSGPHYLSSVYLFFNFNVCVCVYIYTLYIYIYTHTHTQYIYISI